MIHNEKRRKIAIEFTQRYTLTTDQRKQLILNKLNRAVEQTRLKQQQDSAKNR
jgi:hypothetical protein